VVVVLLVLFALALAVGANWVDASGSSSGTSLFAGWADGDF
jgi:hypothetical protein